ncbi:hypothetical protein ACIA8C_20415 [Nocardia sp. NPDC051321]|uniref:hypothetical protein n=1 Tax=Nocardia sp. NPDC051321 TaxID=3364323 RepID=UPI0037AE2E5A
MLFPTPPLSNADERVLSDVERLQDELHFQVQGAPGALEIASTPTTLTDPYAVTS